MNLLLFATLVLVLLVPYSECYNILVLFPHPGKSHFDVFAKLFESLARKGHNVTVVGYCPVKEQIPNYRDVVLGGEAFKHVIGMEDVHGTRDEMWTGGLFIADFAKMTCEPGLKSKSFQEFLKEDNKFDLILAEFFNSNCFMGAAKKYKAPLIGLSSCMPIPWTLEWFASPEHPAYIPVVFMDYSDKMTFLERVENTVMLYFNKLVYKYLIDRLGTELSKKYFGEDIHEGKDVMYNSSLMLVNTHFTLNRPRPLSPSVIEVGGVHVGTPKVVPKNIEKWIKESPHGVIYFSLGSMIKGHTFPEDKRQVFLKAFSRLPQRVLWKWENDSMPDQPPNVMTQKWMPQLDILCHPNVKAFISHGGLLGTIETVHCGVPAIVMPQYGDQHTNARALEASGGGIIMKLADATEELLYNNLKTILQPEFQQKAKDLSERYRDRPLPPLETAIYWIEYVARHRGAPHMRTAAVDMPFYQYYLLDVLGFLLVVIVGSLYVTYRLVGCFVAVLFGRGKQKVKTS